MIEHLAFGFIGVVVVQFSALWFKLGKLEGKIESLILGRRKENVD